MGTENATLACPQIFPIFSRFRAYEFYPTVANLAEACGIFLPITPPMSSGGILLSYLTKSILFTYQVILGNFIR